MNIGIGISINNPAPLAAGYTPSAGAAAWREDIIGRSGSISDNVLQAFDDNIFTPGASILAAHHAMWVYINKSNNIAARVSLEGNDIFSSFVSSPTFDDEGVKSSGTSYVDTNFNPNGIVAQNDVIVWAIVDAPAFSSTVRIFGSVAATERLDINEISGNAAVFVNTNDIALNSNTVTTGNVLIYGKRSNGTQQTAGINSSAVTSSSNSVAVPNYNMYLLTTNNAGTPNGDYCVNYVKACGVSDASIDPTEILTMVNNLESALSAL